MIYIGKKEDLYKAQENSNKFRKIIASMLLTGAIIGISTITSHAAGLYNSSDQTVSKPKIAGHSAKIDKEIQKMYERDDLIDKYRMMGYSEESAKRQADYDITKKDFISSLRTKTNKNNEKIVSIPNNNKIKTTIEKDNDRSRW